MFKMIPLIIFELDENTQHIITMSPKTMDLMRAESPSDILGRRVGDIMHEKNNEFDVIYRDSRLLCMKPQKTT
jgi:hypothetical protein